MEKHNAFLYNVVEVQEVNQVSLVNEELAKGWKLLEIYTTTYDPQAFYKHQEAIYVLGRFEEPKTK